jgi:hypothetical protein
MQGRLHKRNSLSMRSLYSGRKITESLGNVTVRGEERWKEQGGRAIVNSLSMYSITENIYSSQLSSVTTLLQPEPSCFSLYNTRKRLCFLSLCAIVLRSPPASHVPTSNGQWSSQLFCGHYKRSFKPFSETPFSFAERELSISQNEDMVFFFCGGGGLKLAYRGNAHCYVVKFTSFQSVDWTSISILIEMERGNDVCWRTSYCNRTVT